jgi:predicted DNA-binding ribbon-helix-helix protein
MIHRRDLPHQRLKRTVHIARRKTSVSLEALFWASLKEIAALERMPASALVARIDAAREHLNLSSAVRLFVLDYYRRLAVEKAKR